VSQKTPYDILGSLHLAHSEKGKSGPSSCEERLGTTGGEGFSEKVSDQEGKEGVSDGEGGKKRAGLLQGHALVHRGERVPTDLTRKGEDLRDRGGRVGRSILRNQLVFSTSARPLKDGERRKKSRP